MYTYLVIQLGFAGESERTVVEGETLEICAELVTADSQRYDNQYAISTNDGSARGKERADPDHVDHGFSVECAGKELCLGMQISWNSLCMEAIAIDTVYICHTCTIAASD